MSEDKKNGKQNKTVKPFDPMTLRGVTVRNRIWLPPMDTYSALAQDGKPTPFHYQHYVSRAMGGFGMIIMEATAVAPEGRISPCDLGLWDDGQMDAWRWIVADAKAAGATMAVQLNHAGRKGSTGCHAIGFDGQSVPEEQGGWRTVCPSANAYGSLACPRALSVDEIHTIVDQFRDAAWRAMNIGFDAVEVHAAHGYLLSQFLAPLINERDDEYGGSFDNRVRMLVEVVDAIRSVVPDTMPVLVRVSATDWAAGGWDLDQTVELAKILKAHGVDLIDVSTGGLIPDVTIPVKPDYQVPFAEQVRSRAGRRRRGNRPRCTARPVLAAPCRPQTGRAGRGSPLPAAIPPRRLPLTLPLPSSSFLLRKVATTQRNITKKRVGGRASCSRP